MPGERDMTGTTYLSDRPHAINAEEIRALHTFREQRRRRRKPAPAWNAEQRLRWHEKRIEKILAASFLLLLLICAAIAMAANARECHRIGARYEPFRCVTPPATGFGSFTA